MLLTVLSFDQFDHTCATLWQAQGHQGSVVSDWLPVSYREKLIGQILAVVDAAVHGDEALQRSLVLHVGVVQAGVEHDNGERQDVTCVCRQGKAEKTRT